MLRSHLQDHRDGRVDDKRTGFVVSDSLSRRRAVKFFDGPYEAQHQFSYFRVGRPHSVRRRSGGKSTEIDTGLPVIRIFYGELERRQVGVELSVG